MYDPSPVNIEAPASMRPVTSVLHALPFGIEILVSPGGGIITSQLESVLGQVPDRKIAVDTLESLLLAMACQGLDVSTPQMVQAVHMAVESLRQRPAMAN